MIGKGRTEQNGWGDDKVGIRGGLQLGVLSQWRQRLGNFGEWIDAKGKVSWGTEFTQRGSRGKDPVGGLVDEKTPS